VQKKNNKKSIQSIKGFIVSADVEEQMSTMQELLLTLTLSL
jgi:hypothetical protein